MSLQGTVMNTDWTPLLSKTNLNITSVTNVVDRSFNSEFPQVYVLNAKCPSDQTQMHLNFDAVPSVNKIKMISLSIISPTVALNWKTTLLCFLPCLEQK